MSRIDEPVSVWTTEAGVPTRLEWRATTYAVTDRPTEWFAPAEWWAHNSRSPRDLGAVLVREVPMWRFQANAGNGDSLIFDVSHTEDSWHVVHVYL